MVDLIADPKTGRSGPKTGVSVRHTKSNLQITRISRNTKLTNVLPTLFISYM